MAIYACQSCGKTYKQWMGRCTFCNEWNTIEEQVEHKSSISKKKDVVVKNIELDKLENLGETEETDRTKRYPTNILELDRVLGGGLVHSTTILISGEPGIGKSTLLLQLCEKFSKSQLTVCYITGEESIGQIKVRANRLKITDPNIKLFSTNSLEEICSVLRSMPSPGVAIIDSIQTVAAEDISSAPGTINQVKTCALELINLAKSLGLCLIIVGHINKDGQIAGPKLLEHMVDVVLSFEGENSKQYRIIRGTKNRYGSTNEIGVFEMTNDGLIEVQNPSTIFMSENNKSSTSGACIFAGMEGTRVILLEVQALVAPSFMPMPRRSAIGWDTNRLSMLIAILNARMGLNMSDKEVYLNVAGGTKISETGLDLAVAVALISAHKNISVNCDSVFVGEIGLLGELRGVPHIENRAKEAVKLGFKKIITASYSKKITPIKGIKIIQITHIRDIISTIMQKD